MATLRFSAGTIELLGLDRGDPRVPPPLAWDARAARHRAPAMAYADVVRALREEAIAFDDEAAGFGELAATPRVHREPRPYQEEALAAWSGAGGRGVVVLPTGAGKTHVAVMAIAKTKRSALVVAPTLDLVRQWFDLLRATFGDGAAIGVVGGGDHRVEPITVTTYDSAHLHMEHLGARFGLVVFDECHHLPGPSYAQAARMCVAPWRLGLTATPDERGLDDLVGPVVYRKEIGELAGEWLADYETTKIGVELSPEERALHDAERRIYLAFVGKHRIRLASPRGFSDFVMRASQSAEGRRAMRAYRRQRELAFAASAKLSYLSSLLDEHAADRAIVFTQDNRTAYEVARRFLVPIITHQTKVTERSAILDAFQAGTYGAIVTSKVLNEGVDVRDANVAIVLSGSGTVREHVQRLGRILRPREGKRAVLYELVTSGTAETGTSQRRRDHDAYR